MNPTDVIILIAVLVVVLVGAILAMSFINRQRTKDLQDHFGMEYSHTVEVLGDEKKAQEDLLNRQKHVEALDIRPLTAAERAHYQQDWDAIQLKFVDEPGQAIVDADHLIVEVMTLRAYPVSDFEQRAADLSVDYPALVTNYRAARAIALRHKEGRATTEELRQAMVNYRSLFDELVGTQTQTVSEKEI